MGLEVVWAEAFSPVVGHGIFPFQASGPGNISLYQWDVAYYSIILVWYLWSDICIIWDEVGFLMGWFPFFAPWVHCSFCLDV